MDTQPNAEPNGTPAPAPEKKKTLFDTILTMTPVLLTVVATFMVGRSSAEMTQAQYHRAVAGQNQSKVGDEWGYFQAKRIRGTIYEMNADVLIAKEEPVPVTLKYLLESVKELGDKVGKGKDQENATKAIAKVTNDLEKGFNVGKFSHPPEKIKKAFEVFAKTTAFKLPSPLVESAEEKKKDEEDLSALKGTDAETQKKLLKLVVSMIENRKPEKDINDVVIKITDETLHEALVAAHKQGKDDAKALKDPEFTLEAVDQLMFNMASAIYGYLELLDNQSDKKDGAADLRKRTHRLMNSYTMARHTYSHRRYEKDARNNQVSANLYEVNVHLSGAKSDRNLARSFNFMIAMLVAQVGVIIASVAMAVRMRSVVWLFATLAGLAAIGFGGYVYLGMSH